MDIEWDTRPAPPQYRQEWHEHGVMSHYAASPPPSTQTTPTNSSLSQRRRSSAAHGRPAVPPPNLPIPSVPSSPPSRQPLNSPPITFEVGEDGSLQGSHIHGRGYNSYSRPAPSANLSAVAAFSQSRQGLNGATNPPIEPGSAFTTHDDLSDPPPQSFLPPPPSQSELALTSGSMSRRREQEIPSEDLLQPTAAHRSDRRSENRQPSSRRALTRALELAREAVQLDSTNDNPEAAVQAYAQSVALLSEVMERVRRGDESTMDSRRRRRRSVAAQEDEIRRLQNIHDTYADRMNILSIIYSIPAVPYPTGPAPESNPSHSPTASGSPSSDGSPHVPQGGSPQYAHEDPGQDGIDAQDPGSIYLLDEQVLSRSTNPQTTSAGQHPYAAQYETIQTTSPGASQSRASTLLRRGRALSNLPPAPPPPSDTLPPAPTVVEPARESARNSTRPDTNKARPPPVETRARRISNSQLGSLREEAADPGSYEIRERSSSFLDPSRLTKRASPPLPPLPSPPPTSGSSAPNTPRGSSFNTKTPPSPRLASSTTSRPRGTSQLTTRSEFANQPAYGYAGAAPIPVPGLPPQRRTTKISGPSTRSASPADSTTSAGSVPRPNNPPHTRTRSSSQPGRRPSLGGGRVSPPPLPNGAAVNGVMRKASFPSKVLPPALPPLHLDPSNPNLHPGALFSPHLPTTPTSPLPPLPPSDPMLKPYHMMNLLRNTIISPTGGYITRRLHVPCEVWSQGGAKLTNVAEKVRIVDILCAALEDLQISSGEHFGPGNVNNGMALGIGSIGRKEAEAWLGKLDEFLNICDGVVANFSKKLGVGEGFVLKKTTWSDKFTRRLDKFTNGKNLDSPASYVQGLNKLFGHSQLLDEHSRALLSHPMAPAYTAFPHDVRGLVEQRLKRSSEFFATVVLTFVIRDLSQLLDKYVKKCEKWLAE